MAIEIRDFTVTIPAGTPISANFSSDMSFPARQVTEIHVRVPPGPRGEVGFALGTGGLNVVPFGAGTWIVTDNEDLVYPLTATIESGAWQLLAYNTGSFDHTIRVYFYCELINASVTSSGSSLLDGSTIAGDTGSSTDTGTGTGDTSGTGTTTITPPVVTPPSTTATTPAVPVLLPPVLPTAPGSASSAPAPIPSELLIGVAGESAVYLLINGAYLPVVTQDDAQSLSGAGVGQAAVSNGQDAALLAAYPAASTGTNSSTT